MSSLWLDYSKTTRRACVTCGVMCSHYSGYAHGHDGSHGVVHDPIEHDGPCGLPCRHVTPSGLINKALRAQLDGHPEFAALEAELMRYNGPLCDGRTCPCAENDE